MVLQPPVGIPDGGIRVAFRMEQQHRVHVLAAGRPAGDHRGVPHAGALAHGPLHVFREHVEAVRG